MMDILMAITFALSLMVLFYVLFWPFLAILITSSSDYPTPIKYDDVLYLAIAHRIKSNGRIINRINRKIKHAAKRGENAILIKIHHDANDESNYNAKVDQYNKLYPDFFQHVEIVAPTGTVWLKISWKIHITDLRR